MSSELKQIDYLADSGTFGFVSMGETGITFNGTNLFTLVSIGTSWSYYRSGIKCTITGDKTITLTGTPVSTGKHYIYIDSNDGSLIDGTAWTLQDTKVPVAVLYFDNTQNPKFLLSNERHTCAIKRPIHRMEHIVEGTKVGSCSITANSYTLNTPTDAGNTFGINLSNIYDEDLNLILAALTDTNGTTANYRILYRNNANLISWAWVDSLMPFIYTGTNPYTYLQYDLNGTMTASANNRFVNYYLFVSNAIASGEAIQGTSNCPCRFSLIPGRGSFTSTSLAYAENFASFSLAGLPFDEGIAVYQITFDTSGVANTVKGRCQINRVQAILANIVQTTVVNTVVNTVSSAMPLSNITASGTENITLTNNYITNIWGNLLSSNAITVLLGTPTASIENVSVFRFRIGASLPTFVQPKIQRTGTVSVVVLTSNITVNGVGTLFNTEYRVGDTIMIGSVTKTIATIVSDTVLTVTVAYTVDVTTQNHFHLSRWLNNIVPTFAINTDWELVYTQSEINSGVWIITITGGNY